MDDKPFKSNEKRRIRVRGQVQGVGFRPFVWQLAQRFQLRGQVQNDEQGVLIFASGSTLDLFEQALQKNHPKIARVDSIESASCDFPVGDSFQIVDSKGSIANTGIAPDAAICNDCHDELFDPQNRRFAYPFINCTNCGPRFSIVRSLPYDRIRTTMATFQMCPACKAEYNDPTDRRFHAEPIACKDCGPCLWIEPYAPDPITAAITHLNRGEILAIKGLGGFHLACDATNATAIQMLRARKNRPTKSFALMGTLGIINDYCAPTSAETDLLTNPSAPIVLLAYSNQTLPKAIAPNQSSLGWMLPYTPLHCLLVNEFGKPMVMTSGNISGNPPVISNTEARTKLATIADAFLMHDREILRQLDDGVEKITAHGPMVLRRARGRAPACHPLPPGFEDAPKVIAYGGHKKSTICLIKDGAAILGHHLGNLDTVASWDAYRRTNADYSAIYGHQPDVAACDLHPDYRSSQHAATQGLPLVHIQHHHAHLAACLAENNWPLDKGPVAGIILDGLGLGPDGSIWGGEILLGDYLSYERRHWLSPSALIGGDLAQNQPWRNALARLDAAGLDEWANALFPDEPLNIARQMMQNGINSPQSSSAGRFFDAVAAILGICPHRQTFEGEAAMQLEALAKNSSAGSCHFDFDCTTDLIDPTPIWPMLKHTIVAGCSKAVIARAIHESLARAFATKAKPLVESGNAHAIALSGGCFQNDLFLELIMQELQDIPVLIHRKFPPNDGSLALGQAMAAAAQTMKRLSL